MEDADRDSSHVRRLGGDGRHRRIKADRVKAASRSELQCAGLEVLRWPCAGGLVEMEGTADSRFPPLKLLAFHRIAASPSVFSVAISQALRWQLGMDMRIYIPAQVGGESIEEASADFGKESADDAVSAFAFGMLQLRAGLDQIRQHFNEKVLVVCSAKEPESRNKN